MLAADILIRLRRTLRAFEDAPAPPLPHPGRDIGQVNGNNEKENFFWLSFSNRFRCTNSFEYPFWKVGAFGLGPLAAYLVAYFFFRIRSVNTATRVQ